MRIPRATLTALLALLLLQAGCSKRPSGQNTANASGALQQDAPDAPDGDARALYERGVEAYRDNRDEEAVEDLRKAVELDPDFAEAHYRLGLALRATDQKEEADKVFADAVKAYEKLTKQEPKNAEASYFLGLCYEKLGKYEDAARALKDSVHNLSESDENRDDKYYELAIVQYKLAQYDEAVAALNKALEINPNNYPASDLLEKARAGAQRVDEIRKHQEQLLKQKNVNANANLNGNSNAGANANTNANANQNSAAPPSN